MASRSTTTESGAYQGATEACLSIVVAIALGYWADEYFGTEPKFLIVGVIVGFASFVLRLIRMGKLVKEIAAESEQQGSVTKSSSLSRTNSGSRTDAGTSPETGAKLGTDISTEIGKEKE